MDYNCFCDYLGTEEMTKEEYDAEYKRCIELYQKGGY